LVLGVLWLTYRFTAPLTNLTKVAVALQKQNYEVQIDITPQDELGALGRAFSQMVQEIKQHNQKLEQTVQQRTLELEQANQQINLLNLNLEAENFRMRAELIVTKNYTL
jgi:sigma-B regulation protein RsbU (phosphoserine phosphatase)